MGFIKVTYFVELNISQEIVLSTINLKDILTHVVYRSIDHTSITKDGPPPVYFCYEAGITIQLFHLLAGRKFVVRFKIVIAIESISDRSIRAAYILKQSVASKI